MKLPVTLLVLGSSLLACGGQVAIGSSELAERNGSDGGTLPVGTVGTPEVLATLPSAGFIAVDATSIYVAPYPLGAVYAVPIDGGTPRVVNHNSGDTLALDTAHVYSVYTVTGPNQPPPDSGSTVVQCAKTGCDDSPTTITLGQVETLGIAVDDTAVYSSSPSGLTRSPLDGGPETLLTASVHDNEFLVAGGYAYFGRDFGVARVATTGGAETLLTSGPTQPDGGQSGLRVSAADAMNVYCIGGDGSIVRVPMDGTETTTLVPAPQGGAYLAQLAVDGANVYWASNFAILKIPVTGGPIATLVDGQDTSGAIAVDATSVYWTTVPGVLKKIAK